MYVKVGPSPCLPSSVSSNRVECGDISMVLETCPNFLFYTPCIHCLLRTAESRTASVVQRGAFLLECFQQVTRKFMASST